MVLLDEDAFFALQASTSESDNASSMIVNARDKKLLLNISQTIS